MSEQTPLTLQAFISATGVTIAVVPADTNPDWPHRWMEHWTCTLRCGDRQLTVVQSQEFRRAAPTLETVLEELIYQVNTIRYMPEYAGWYAEYEMHLDPREPMAVFAAIQATQVALAALFGEETLTRVLDAAAAW